MTFYWAALVAAICSSLIGQVFLKMGADAGGGSEPAETHGALVQKVFGDNGQKRNGAAKQNAKQVE